MTKLAARVTDAHACGKGHAGTKIQEHSPDVSSVGLKQSRVLDALDCPGDDAAIFSGAATVMVNGLPAAWRGGETSHDGTVDAGAATVHIGGPSLRIPLILVGDEKFKAHARQALARIIGTPTGKQILEKLNSFDYPIFLREGPNRAIGPPATIEWNPYSKQTSMWHPVFSLGHELVHATHGNPKGIEKIKAVRELRTAGARPPLDARGNQVVDANGNPAGTHVEQDGKLYKSPDYSNEQPSENSLRRDLGYPRRERY